MRRCAYLGHIVGELVRPEDGKIEAVKNFTVPTNKKDLRALVGYYHRFLPRFAETSACLSDLTRKSEPNKIRWLPKHQRAFDKLKTCLQEGPVLHCPDYQKQFWLQTDASERGIGAVLSQVGEDSHDHPIAFFSRKLVPREMNYSTTEKECLAIICALRHFEVYLLGRTFNQTDHGALQYLQQMKNSNARLMRWVLALQPFDFEILHRPGVKHNNADGLSRQSWPTLSEETIDCFTPKEGEGDVGVAPPSYCGTSPC